MLLNGGKREQREAQRTLTKALIVGAALCILFFLVMSLKVEAFDIVIGWNQNPEVDIAGYKLYITQDANAWPAEPTSTMTYEELSTALIGLADGTWHIGLTAFDWANNESDRSTIAVVWPDDEAPGSPPIKQVVINDGGS